MNRLRLSGGAHGGRRIAVPSGARPTEGRVREALLSIWSERLIDSRVLDLFAGSGAVGFEALGRGALWLTSIDRDSGVVAQLRRTREQLGVERASEVLRMSLPTGLRRAPGEPYDLLFADPPYRFTRYGELLVLTERWAAPGAELAIEHDERTPLEEAGPWMRTDHRNWGETAISFFRRRDETVPPTRIDPFDVLP